MAINLRRMRRMAREQALQRDLQKIGRPPTPPKSVASRGKGPSQVIKHRGRKIKVPRR